MEKLSRESGVDGILAGYSEFRVENMIKLCERLNFPCYINNEQLEITRDKIKFKECCRKYGVPVVKLDLRVDEHTELEIFAEPNPPKRVSRPEACGLRHLAFCVESVEQTVKELAEVGIECEPIRVDDFTGKKMTFFHDPDGLPLELHE